MKKARNGQQATLVVHSQPTNLFRNMETSPAIVQFETICGCNANCTFCSYGQMTRPKGLMDYELIEGIIRQAERAESLIPFLIGEPFLDQRMRDILALCKKTHPSAATILYSNMALCDAKTAEWLVHDQTLDRLCPSFYGPTPEIYRALQPPLDFHQVRQNIIHLLRLRQAMGKRRPRVEMQYILMDKTAGLLDQFKKYWSVIADGVAVVNHDTWHGLKADQSPAGFRRYPPGPIPCSRLWDSFNVHYDGTVVACCIDLEEEEVIGRMPRQTLKEVWHGKPLQRLRSLHLAGRQNEIPLCRNCTSWSSNPSWWINFWTQALYG
ncbi:MAG: SPASM domain-containing protein [Bacillota bacterium]|nr:SPASM domain-containing protein [Bacillota bacterium]